MSTPYSNSSFNLLSPDDYSFRFSRTPRPCVDMIISSPEGLLLGWRDTGAYQHTWGLPGGRIRMRETVEAALSGIAQNELASQIKECTLLGYMEFLHEEEHGEPRHSISLAFRTMLAVQSLPESILTAKKLRWFKVLPPDVHPVQEEFLLKHGWKRE